LFELFYSTFQCEVIDSIPKVKTLQEWVANGKLVENLYSCHPLSYPLMTWLLGSNRTHLKKLSSKERISEMETEHQYYLLSATPEKEEKFQKYKKQYGSLWAFHGSGLANWHAIFRNGLKNMSGTSGQLNGAAYGSGIYLASESATSFGYAREGNIWKNCNFY
jgi:poly [ADP-ribose] polymerase 6/8